MHQYLRAVGFSTIENKKQERDLLNDCIIDPNKKDYVNAGRDNILVEYSKNYSPSCGIAIRGEYDDANTLTLDFYYPFVLADKISTNEGVSIERHAANESFAGFTEDYRVGVSLIYYIQNGIEFINRDANEKKEKNVRCTSFSALSLEGTIMLPIKKDPKQREQILKANADRNKRIMAAKNGDEEAIEQLTMEDIDTYSAVSRRILTDDVFTLVDSYLMPYGVECDQYSILAEIEECRLEKNILSGEEIYIMDLSCNGLPITLCINSKDLLGEPLAGRRFRGNIWLQGSIV